MKTKNIDKPSVIILLLLTFAVNIFCQSIYITNDENLTIVSDSTGFVQITTHSIVKNYSQKEIGLVIGSG
jgi:hypothetical protein